MSDAGQVSALKIVVKGDRPVLLLDGEELLGAKQNRVVNLTILAPAQRTTVIPVSCVESGRWHHDPEHSRRRRARSSPKAAPRTCSRCPRSLMRGHRRSDQGEVWSLIAGSPRA